MKLVLITGLSGAGKSVALKALEDTGFEAIDNIPVAFLPAVAAMGSAKLVVGVDVRSRDFSPARLLESITQLRARPGTQLTVLYLDCDDESLRRRFTETRRRHPLAHDRPVTDGIQRERELVEGLRDHADHVLDTSEMNAGDLKRTVTAMLAGEGSGLSISLVSFSYKRGLPREADLVFDVRFLRNPYYDEALRPLTGQDANVGAYIKEDAAYDPFFQRLQTFLLPLLPAYAAEGKRYLTLALGCTGGQHRSVFVAEELGKVLKVAGYSVEVRHREAPHT